MVDFAHFQVQARQRGVLGWGWGCLVYVHIPKRSVWLLSKEHGLGVVFWVKWDPVWAKWDPSGQCVRKMGKSALELGEKNSIMGKAAEGVAHSHPVLALASGARPPCRPQGASPSSQCWWHPPQRAGKPEARVKALQRRPKQVKTLKLEVRNSTWTWILPEKLNILVELIQLVSTNRSLNKISWLVLSGPELNNRKLKKEILPDL